MSKIDRTIPELELHRVYWWQCLLVCQCYTYKTYRQHWNQLWHAVNNIDKEYKPQKSKPDYSKLDNILDNKNTRKIINWGDTFGFTVLFIAIERGNFVVVEKLIDHKADVNAKNASNTTPLHIAAWNKQNKIYDLLTKKGADPEIKNLHKLTPPELGSYSPMISRSDFKYNSNTKPLGEGHFANIYGGSYLGKEAAIKVFQLMDYKNSRYRDKQIQDCEQEVEIMEKMKTSKHLVKFYGACLTASHYFIVMECMPSGSLYHRLKNKKKPLPLNEIAQIALDIIYGLYDLHKANILHLDLKSLNILLNKNQAKIADFGFSTESKTSRGGTRAWAAPELFQKNSPTNAADIYSFGMILWELTIHPYRSPFHGVPEQDIGREKLRRKLEQESIDSKNCPADLADIIKHCWQISPKKRPTAAQLSESLSKLFNSLSLSNSKSISSSDSLSSFEGNLESRHGIW